ncbi:hypothetical protein DSO57_1027655 [Entomophthora muscae]|uniref:Uncharacterized protein n=1 Tax=Entomophthora muscae TaxID=34485 RepID=A0ACC2TCL7_9FUNG|nr:hypothetical protein DSO57_1027655 [Entomophthora muscae]
MTKGKKQPKKEQLDIDDHQLTLDQLCERYGTKANPPQARYQRWSYPRADLQWPGNVWPQYAEPTREEKPFHSVLRMSHRSVQLALDDRWCPQPHFILYRHERERLCVVPWCHPTWSYCFE